MPFCIDVTGGGEKRDIHAGYYTPVMIFTVFHDVTDCDYNEVTAEPLSSRKTHLARSWPLSCCQSTPVINQLNSSWVSDQALSPARGQRKCPLCRRRTHSQTPCLSQRNTLMRERALLVKTKAAPSCHDDFSSSWTFCVRVSIPRRISTGCTARKTLSGFSIT